MIRKIASDKLDLYYSLGAKEFSTSESENQRIFEIAHRCGLIPDLKYRSGKNLSHKQAIKKLIDANYQVEMDIASLMRFAHILIYSKNAIQDKKDNGSYQEFNRNLRLSRIADDFMYLLYDDFKSTQDPVKLQACELIIKFIKKLNNESEKDVIIFEDYSMEFWENRLETARDLLELTKKNRNISFFKNILSGHPPPPQR
jgi:hypothetical protein